MSLFRYTLEDLTDERTTSQLALEADETEEPEAAAVAVELAVAPRGDNGASFQPLELIKLEARLLL